MSDEKTTPKTDSATPASPQTPAPDASPKPAEKVGPPKNGKRILIVEDERPLAHALELKFTHEGYETKIAANGSEGLQIAQKENFDMILLDLIMPELDGFAFMEQLGKKVPVIVLSNLGQEEDKTRALAMGAVAYFVKSNTPITEIIKKVKETL